MPLSPKLEWPYEQEHLKPVVSLIFGVLVVRETARDPHLSFERKVGLHSELCREPAVTSTQKEPTLRD